MDPKEFGRKLGIGVRVAGRVAQQRAQQRTPQPAPPSAPGRPQILTNAAGSAARVQKHGKNLSRAAGRGVGGFLRPFGRVGGILWLEVTGFFFGMFALYFAQDIWRTRLSYAQGLQHQRFLIAVALTGVFGYLCVSAFWRARRK